MTMSTTRITIATLATLGLAACGGGGGGDTTPGGGGGGGPTFTTPTASTGFATSGSTFDTTVTIIPDGDNITTRTSGGSTTSENPANVQLRFSENGDVLTMRIRDVDTRLTRTNATTYSNNNVLLKRLLILDTSANGDLNLGRAIDSGEGFGKDIIFAYGFDTDPATVRAESGDAVFYDGSIVATAVQATNDETANGNIQLIANFNNDTIDGTFTLGRFGSLTDTTSWALTNTTITGNGFSTTATLAGNGLDPDQTLQSANIDGRFYGTDAGAIGGAFSATITDNTTNPIFLQGGYVAEVD